MNRTHQRSYSPYDFINKIMTDRSQNQSHTHRNSTVHLIDSMAHKNVSQTIRKEERKSFQPKINERKKSVSSYYFQNIKKGQLKTDQSLGNYLNNKNPNDNKRKRSQTSFNFTTNKIDKQPQQDQQACIIQLCQQTCEPSKNTYFCLNHPKKIAYFEEQNSQACYCHECSIENVKKNKRLIQLTPEIKEAKRLISRKIAQTQSYGEQLCLQIQRTIQKRLKQFQQRYTKLKKEFAQKLNHPENHSQTIDFQLRQIDWSLVKNVGITHQIEQFQPFKFLIPSVKKYKMIKTANLQVGKKSITQESASQLTISPIRRKQESVERQLQSELNESENKGFRSKHLLKQIEKALNYQSRNSKLKVKKVNLLCFQQRRQSQSQNKENIHPNYLN